MSSSRSPIVTAIITLALAALIAGCSVAVSVSPSPPPATLRTPEPAPAGAPSLVPPTIPPAPTSSVAPSAATTPPSACPTGPTTIETLIGLRLDDGPLSTRYGARLNERALECLDGTQLTFTAFVAAPEGLGGTVAYVVTPAWMDTWSSSSMYLAASDREAAPGAPFGPFLPVAVPPGVRSAFDRQHGRWATVSGRLDAPAARTCVATPGGGPDIPPPADLVKLCRTSFVVESVAPGADPCPGTVTLRTILATPENGRADCFGGSSVSFTAAGSSINNVWPGLTMPAGYRDWIFGIDGLMFDDTSLAVFVAEAMPLPDPAGTPWANRDTVGGPDAYWRVVGHFDDDLAEACIPDAGYTLATASGDATQVVLPNSDVQTFCRNHLVVDRLTWLPHATASSGAE